MNRSMFQLVRNLLAIATVVAGLSGCATIAVTGAVVGTAATVTKVAVKGTVGAGKLAYKGTKAVVKGTARVIKKDDPELADDPDNPPRFED